MRLQRLRQMQVGDRVRLLKRHSYRTGDADLILHLYDKEWNAKQPPIVLETGTTGTITKIEGKQFWISFDDPNNTVTWFNYLDSTAALLDEID